MIYENALFHLRSMICVKFMFYDESWINSVPSNANLEQIDLT
jgi:hypothetical protein